MRVQTLLVFAVLLTAAGPAEGRRLRVLANTEMRLQPRVSADRRTLEVGVGLHDDHNVAVRGEPVRLDVSLPDGVRYNYPPQPTSEAGATTFRVPIEGLGHVFTLSAAFEGTSRLARCEAQATVDLEYAFITLNLAVPTQVDAEQPFVDAAVTIDPGEISPVRTDGMLVALRADGQQVMTARADGSGHVAFHVPVTALGGPGVRTLVARFERNGAPADSAPRRMIVRARTSLALTRVEPASGSDASRGARLVGALATRTGPVPRAAVRILDGAAHVLAAGLTDARGTFEIALDPEIASRPDLVVHAAYAPSEPWYVGSESAAVRVSPPAPRRVPWTLAGAPVVAAVLLLLLAARLRRRAPASVAAPVAMRPIDDAGVERVGDAEAGNVVRVTLAVVDRATGEPVRGALARWLAPTSAGGEPEARPADAPHEIAGGGGRFSVEVSAPGYSPRALAGELPRGGAYTVRVPIRTWREELFDRARRWMRQAGAVGAPAPPTPREVLTARGARPEAAAFVAHVEAGVYGPDAPDAAAIAQADALARATEAPARGER